MKANVYQLFAEPVQSSDGLSMRFWVENGDSVEFDKVINPNDQEAVIVLCNELVQATGQQITDVEQGVAELVERERGRWLRLREQPLTEASTDDAGSPGPFLAIDERAALQYGIPGSFGIMQTDKRIFLSNFILLLEEDIEIQDDIEMQRVFAGRLRLPGREAAFRIPARDYADNSRLKAEIFAAGGPEIQIHCRIDTLRTAISRLSGEGDRLSRERRTTNFGWTEDGNVYLVPSGCIRAEGFTPADQDVDLKIDLSDEEQARFLDLKPLEPAKLQALKQHVVQDLLPLHDRAMTFSLLGATATAVLQRFAKGSGRFGLWLVGLTGAGKSFVAKLFLNFFGDFPVASGRFATWSSTPNSLQRQGYFYKDALYLIDDYKREVVAPYQVVRILQTYADGTARGRLKSDATANVTRPIRGQLVCTGEDVPEHNASVLARCIVLQVPNREKDLERGRRCVEECENYSGVTADFVRWIIDKQRGPVFAARVRELEQRFYSDVAGQQNDSRVASNLALLGAAFEQFAEYLGDVWPDWREQSRQFVEKDLVEIRGAMLGEVKEQQASTIFLDTLSELVRHERVDVRGPREGRPASSTLIGNREGSWYAISTSLALEAVNRSLREQGKDLLKVTGSALLQQLRDDGKLLNEEGYPLGQDADDLTGRTRLNGKQVRVFRISHELLFREADLSSDEMKRMIQASRRRDSDLQTDALQRVQTLLSGLGESLRDSKDVSTRAELTRMAIQTREMVKRRLNSLASVEDTGGPPPE